MKILFKNANIVVTDKVVSGNVLVENGKIAQISADTDL